MLGGGNVTTNYALYGMQELAQKITYLDLCHTPIYEQLYTCNITAVI